MDPYIPKTSKMFNKPLPVDLVVRNRRVTNANTLITHPRYRGGFLSEYYFLLKYPYKDCYLIAQSDEIMRCIPLKLTDDNLIPSKYLWKASEGNSQYSVLYNKARRLYAKIQNNTNYGSKVTSAHDMLFNHDETNMLHYGEKTCIFVAYGDKIYSDRFKCTEQHQWIIEYVKDKECEVTDMTTNPCIHNIDEYPYSTPHPFHLRKVKIKSSYKDDGTLFINVPIAYDSSIENDCKLTEYDINNNINFMLQIHYVFTDNRTDYYYIRTYYTTSDNHTYLTSRGKNTRVIARQYEKDLEAQYWDIHVDTTGKGYNLYNYRGGCMSASMYNHNLSDETCVDNSHSIKRLFTFEDY